MNKGWEIENEWDKRSWWGNMSWSWRERMNQVLVNIFVKNTLLSSSLQAVCDDTFPSVLPMPMSIVKEGNINSFHVFALLPFLLLLQHSQPWKSSKLQMTVWCHALLLVGKIQMLLVSFFLNTFTVKHEVIFSLWFSKWRLVEFLAANWGQSLLQQTHPHLYWGNISPPTSMLGNIFPTHIFIGEIFRHPHLYWGNVSPPTSILGESFLCAWRNTYIKFPVWFGLRPSWSACNRHGCFSLELRWTGEAWRLAAPQTQKVQSPDFSFDSASEKDGNDNADNKDGSIWCKTCKCFGSRQWFNPQRLVLLVLTWKWNLGGILMIQQMLVKGSSMGKF